MEAFAGHEPDVASPRAKDNATTPLLMRILSPFALPLRTAD
jgi:hypothetical protein